MAPVEIKIITYLPSCYIRRRPYSINHSIFLTFQEGSASFEVKNAIKSKVFRVQTERFSKERREYGHQGEEAGTDKGPL